MMDPREMFNEIYGIGPDDGHGADIELVESNAPPSMAPPP